MSEEEIRRRKMILDAGAALQHQLECMRNTLLLPGVAATSADGRKAKGTTDEMVTRYKAAADQLASLASEIVESCGS